VTCTNVSIPSLDSSRTLSSATAKESTWIVISAVVIGLLIIGSLYRWWRNKHPKPEPNPEQGMEANEGVNLEVVSGDLVRR
jgi:hypothetical protein